MNKALLIVVILLATGAAFAQQPAAVMVPPEINSPPGTTLVTEVNLTDNDILGMIKQAIPAFVQSAQGSKGEFGDFLKNVDLNAIVEAIKDVKVVHAVQYKLGASTSQASVQTFYQGQFAGSEGWSRVLYDTSMAAKGTVAVYSKDGQDFVAVGTDSANKSAYVVRTVGFVNVPQLAAWAGKSMKFFTQLEAEQKAKPAAKKPVKSTRKKPAAKHKTH